MIVFGHVSDTHFGPILANNRSSWVPHQSAHSLSLCLKLHGAFENVRAAHRFPQSMALPIVHSGDLTASGAPEEFPIGHLFMRSRTRITRSPVGGHLGMDLGDNRLLAVVPGNHDHWAGLGGAGNFILGVSARTAWLRQLHFRPTPWHKRWDSLSPDEDPAVLDLFGVDSNSGYPVGQASYRARGRIAPSEFAALESMIRNCTVKRGGIHLRAVVCHHSVSYRGGVSGANELEATSRDRLLDLCDRHNVHAILTGHTHDFHAANLVTPTGHVVRELRCASTLAMSQPINGFLVHRIGNDGRGQRMWTCHRYGWNGTNYARNPAPLADFAV